MHVRQNTCLERIMASSVHCSELFVYIAGTLLHETLTAPAQLQACPVARVPDPPRHQSHDKAEPLPESCPACNIFYTDFVVLTDAAVVALETRTRGRTNVLWADSRKLRVTASNVKRIPKRDTTLPGKTLIALTENSFQGNAATRRGRLYEPVARAKFQSETGLTVSPCGTLVCAEEAWLSATPDGIVQTCNAILEIKCPDVEDCKVMIATSKKYDVKLKDKTYIMSKNGPYGFYSQVQFTMLCT